MTTLFSKKTVSLSELMRHVVMPVLLGLASGLAGALMIESYFATLSASVAEPLQLGRLPAATPASMIEPVLAERLGRTDAVLYPHKPTSGLDLAERARIATEGAGYATIITSDGWLATAASALNASMSVAVNGRLLAPTKQVADPRTGLVFLKVDASDLPVSAFEDTDALRPGTPLYVMDEAGLFATATFAGVLPADRKALQNSDRFGRTYRLDRPLGNRSVGGAVLSKSGAIVGVMVSGEAFVPAHLFQPILSQVFRGEKPLRAALGANYLSLEDIALAEGGFGELKGARLTGSRSLGIPAVRLGSAAGLAGLQEGDIVLRVAGADLTNDGDLAEMIAAFVPGAKVRLDVLKDGAERSVEVTLDGEKR